MQQYKKILKKVSKKEKHSFPQQIPHQIRQLQMFIKSGVTEGQFQRVKEILSYFNIQSLLELWQNAEECDKNFIIKALSVKYYKQGQKVATFKANQLQKQMLIFLKGQVSYRFSIENRINTLQYPIKIGQTINQSYPEDLQFKQFSLTCNFLSIFLQVSCLSTLKDRIIKEKNDKFEGFLNNFKKFDLNNSQNKNYRCLMPYSSSSKYIKKQIIYPKTIKKSNYFCYVSEGEVQIIRISKSGKQISIISLPNGEFFDLFSIIQIDQNIIIKCKSIKCEVFCFPTIVIQQYGSVELISSINKHSKSSSSLYLRMMRKNDKILADPIKYKKLKNKKKVKKQKMSNFSQNSWDLISHVANQMKIRQLPPYIKNYSYSAHVSPRKSSSIQKSIGLNKIQRLKNRIFQEKNRQDFSSQKQNIPNAFRAKLKTSCDRRSNLFQLFAKATTINYHKEQRQGLVKKTKFKLLRYAKGNNLYGLNDYF